MTFRLANFSVSLSQMLVSCGILRSLCCNDVAQLVTLPSSLKDNFCVAFWAWIEQEVTSQRQEDVRIFDDLAEIFRFLPVYGMENAVFYL